MSALSRALRRDFFALLLIGLKVVWPVLSGLIGIMMVLGCTVGWLEGWSMYDSVYFSFVTGLTIGTEISPRICRSLDFSRL